MNKHFKEKETYGFQNRKNVQLYYQSLKWKQNHSEIWFYSHKFKEKKFDINKYGGNIKQQRYLQISGSTVTFENSY